MTDDLGILLEKMKSKINDGKDCSLDVFLSTELNIRMTEKARSARTSFFIESFLCKVEDANYFVSPDTIENFFIAINKEFDSYSINSKDIVGVIKLLDYKEFLETKLWQIIKIYIKKKEKTCVLCNNDESLDVHHRSYENHGLDSQNRILRIYPVQDLTLLCRDCHDKFHKYNKG